MTAALDLGYKPRAWQIECHKRTERFQVHALHRRAGKTVLSSMRLTDSALRTTAQGATFVYLAPFLKQAKAIFWSMLKLRLEPLRLRSLIEINESELFVRFVANGATIRLFGADNPDALRGMRIDGIVVDEVSQIHPAVWNEIIQPALSDRLGWAQFIGTPHGVNLFSELFHKALNTAGWWAGKWTVYDTQAIDAEEVERLRRDMSEQAFAREYLCDFSAAGDDQLLSVTDIEAACRREYGNADLIHSPRIIGVDPARSMEGDRSVIARRQGLQVLPFYAYRGINNMELAARVHAVIEEWSPDAVFIDAGNGAGVIDRLRQLGRTVIEVPFGGTAIAAKLYTNRRTEMWFGMAEAIRSGLALPKNDPELMVLKQELATPVFWFDKKDKKVLESKDQIKTRLMGGASPDFADALALTFAHPVVQSKPKFEFLTGRKRKKGMEYDPFTTTW